VTVPTHLSDVATAVMTRVIAEDAALTSAWELSLSALPKHASPPRMVWMPTTERIEPAQKRPGPHSVCTVLAGFAVAIWGADITATETLRTRLLRALLLTLGPEPFRGSYAGEWIRDVGATTLGAGYLLTGAYALDVPRAATAPATTIPTSVVLDTTRSTVGDGYTDAGEGT
jgi:hypothetical protein